MAFHSTYSPNFDCLAMVGAASGPTALGNNTLAAWVNFNSLATDGEIIEVNASGGGNGAFDSAIIWNLASAKLEFTQRTSTTNRDFVPTFTVTTNTWIHVALTWDGTNLLAYANGALIGSNTTGAMAGTRGNWGGLQLGPATADIQDGVFYTAALSADEILQLYRQRQPKRRNNLYCHIPCFPGSNRGVDLSGNANNLPASGTPVDSTIVPPSVGWGSGRSRLFLPAATVLTADGATQTTGAAAVTAAASIPASGTTQTTGAAAVTASANVPSSGTTQTTGTAAVTASASAASAGTTQVTGVVAMTAAAALAASGITQTTGTATMTKSAALAQAGTTQTTGAATFSVITSIPSSGATQTSGTANVTSSGGGGGGGVSRLAVYGPNPGARRHSVAFGTRRILRK